MEVVSSNPNIPKQGKHRRGQKERRAEEENLRKLREECSRKLKEARRRMEDDEDESRKAVDEESSEWETDEKRKRKGERRRGRKDEKLEASRLVDAAFQKAAKQVRRQEKIRSNLASPETPQEMR
ncbi:hypothetical protein TELCIR_10505 [Teladorsagia circumcincta]|uniref:Uncharacterized protein n=1 Tax=Teladorsagia circumcincta TaxID=45464 RepID=A0A2G9UBX9_TELCI|nr:hypothetical protein TELCIR_10505 [Teladorsagia circumcincta]